MMRWRRGFLRLWVILSVLWVVAVVGFYYPEFFHEPVSTLWELQEIYTTQVDCTAFDDEAILKTCRQRNELKKEVSRQLEEAWQKLGETWWLLASSVFGPPALLLLIGYLDTWVARGFR